MTAAAPDFHSRLAEVLAEAPAEWTCLYLFGSQATGRNHPNSDVDVAFLSEGPTSEFPYELADAWSGRLGARVDLVDLARAPVDLIHEVLRDGRIMLDRDPALRVRFEVLARKRYLDLRPMLLRYRRIREAS